MDKKLLKTEFIKNSDLMQITVEGEIIISDTQPDIKEIISESVKPVITFRNVTDGRISFKGTLTSCIVYISKDSDNPVSAVLNVTNFEDIMNIEGLEKDDCINIRAYDDHFEFRKINERKVSVKAVITIEVREYKNCQCISLSPDAADDGTQLLVGEKTVRNHVSQDKTDFDIHETYSIPSPKHEVEEILTQFYTLSDIDTRAMRGGYRITGNLNVDLLYTTNDGTLADTAHFQVPFEHTVDNDDITEDMHAISSIDVSNVKAGAFEDSSGENRIIDIDAVFNEVTDVFEDEKITYVKDAYCVNNGYQTETEKITMPVFTGRNKARFNLKGTAGGNTGADIMQVIGAEGNVSVDSVYPQNGSVAVEGVADITVLYIARDDARPVYSMKAYIPFHQEMDMSGVSEGDVITADVRVEGVAFNIMNSSEVEVTVNLSCDAEALKLEEVEVVSDIKKDENADSAVLPAAVIYTVQNGETLWDISKKYGAVKEDILSLNNMEKEEELKDKKKILIMRRV